MISLRSDSDGWINVGYVFLRTLPLGNSNYMPFANVSNHTIGINQAGFYSVTFLPLNAPSGLNWSLSIANNSLTTRDSPIVILLENGTYDYHVATFDQNYSVTPAYGNITVSGKDIEVGIRFTLLFELFFHHKGLPDGWYWTVVLNNDLLASSFSSSIVIWLKNGTYSYSANSANPAFVAHSGNVTVKGSSLSIDVHFVSLTSGKEPLALEGFILLITVAVAVVASVCSIAYWRMKQSPPQKEH